MSKKLTLITSNSPDDTIDKNQDQISLTLSASENCEFKSKTGSASEDISFDIATDSTKFKHKYSQKQVNEVVSSTPVEEIPFSHEVNDVSGRDHLASSNKKRESYDSRSTANFRMDSSENNFSSQKQSRQPHDLTHPMFGKLPPNHTFLP